MNYEIKRTNKQVDDVCNEACEAECQGRSQWPGMTYEQGVQAALMWVTGQSDDNPMAG